jgi:hypothetical protein
MRHWPDDPLADVKLALDRMLRDEDAVTLEALADPVAHIDGEITALAAEARAGLELGDVVMRLDALRQEIDRRMAPH